MNKAITLTQAQYESSSSHTPEYLHWHRTFKREFTKFLTENGATDIKIGKPNHFDMSGFFTVGTQPWYFRIEDLRWSKNNMLIRTCKDYRDFTGGMNQYVSLQSADQFSADFQQVFRSEK